MGMFMALIMVMDSWLYTYPKLIDLFTLNMYIFL